MRTDSRRNITLMRQHNERTFSFLNEQKGMMNECTENGDVGVR